VSFYRVSTKTGALVASRTIDDTEILDAYSVTYADINNDGVKELIVNNHEKKDKTDGIWAYHFPTDWMKGDFTRTTLASNFKNKFSLLIPNMAPGFPYPFYPNTSHQGKERAHILVAGDGDHTAHLMTPTDSDFEYELDTIKEMKGTVGALTFDDLDGNKWQEVWVPDYDNSLIEAFVFSEKETLFFQ